MNNNRLGKFVVLLPLIGFPVGYLAVFLYMLPATDWGEYADPDNDWRFLLITTAIGGTLLGVGLSLVFALLLYACLSIGDWFNTRK